MLEYKIVSSKSLETSGTSDTFEYTLQQPQADRDRARKSSYLLGIWIKAKLISEGETHLKGC